MNKEEFRRILKERGNECSFEEFETLLAKYGHDDAYLDALHAGVKERLKYEDSGDYTSPATRGWAPAMKKKKHLELFILTRGPSGTFNTAATPQQPLPPLQPLQTATTNDAELARLQQRVQQLEMRVQQLETRIQKHELTNDARKYKL